MYVLSAWEGRKGRRSSGVVGAESENLAPFRLWGLRKIIHDLALILVEGFSLALRSHDNFLRLPGRESTYGPD